MKKNEISQATFVQIIDQDYTAGAVLDSFGLDFIGQPDRKLKCACHEKNIDLNFLVSRFESRKSLKHPLLLLSYESCERITSHLKETHRYFIRLRLPYMSRVISKMDNKLFEDEELANDLKWLFPEFVFDFSAHVLKEEETIFNYILAIEQAAQKPRNNWKIFQTLQMASMQSIIDNHLEDDDEMLGIRTLTQGYAIDTHTNPYKKLIYSELKSFEEELCYHSRIENDLLFPRAFELEKLLKNHLSWASQMS
jgi:regulator of cell morphogenesis and NO signaling